MAPPAWVDFDGAAQVVQLRRSVTKAGKQTVEVVYAITFADVRTATPATLAAWTNVAHALRHHAASQRRPLALLTS